MKSNLLRTKLKLDFMVAALPVDTSEPQPGTHAAPPRGLAGRSEPSRTSQVPGRLTLLGFQNCSAVVEEESPLPAQPSLHSDPVQTDIQVIQR